MKSLRASWVMSLLVAALAVYTFFEYRKAQNEGTFAEDERASFSFRSENIDYLKIERPQDPVELRKEDDGRWKMTVPVQDDVEETSALSFLLSLTTQRVRLFKPEGEDLGKVDWGKYGLEPALVTFITGAGGKKESLSLGTKNAFDGSFYLRQKDDLLLGDTGFAQLNARSSNSFRSRLLWRERAPVERAEVDGEGLKYAVAKKDGAWTLEPKPNFPLDSAKLEAWLERLEEFKPAEIVKDEITEEDKRSYLLMIPSVTIRLNGSWLLTVGQDRAQDVFLYTSARPTLYKVSTQGIAKIRVPLEFFRDGRKPFEFPVEQARSIEVRSDKLSVTLKKSDTAWVTEKGADVSAEAVTFMQALKALEAREFGGPPKTGIASKQVLVKDGKGEVLLTLAWGNEFKARAPYNEGAPLKYVRTNLDQDVLGVPKEKLESLLSALTPKNGPKDTEKK